MNIDDRIDAIIDAYLAFLEGTRDAPTLNGLDPGERAEAAARIELLDALWGVGAPQQPLDDPVARRFGFDRAGQDITVNGTKIAALRKRRGIVLKDLAEMVNNGGGEVSTRALLDLEQRPAVPVSQRTASALAAALRASVADFEAAATVEIDAVRAFLASAAFDELIASWAAEHHRKREPVRRDVSERMLAAQFRAADVTAEQLLDIARAILRRLER